MSLQRTIRRNILKAAAGNNEINLAWRRSRIQKYGYKNWFYNFFVNSKKRFHGGYWGEYGRKGFGRLLNAIKRLFVVEDAA